MAEGEHVEMNTVVVGVVNTREFYLVFFASCARPTGLKVADPSMPSTAPAMSHKAFVPHSFRVESVWTWSFRPKPLEVVSPRSISEGEAL